MALRGISSKERLARVEEQIHSLDRIVDEKFVTLGTIQKLEADKTALALASDRRAIDKAEFANEKRFEGVNEFRAQLGDQAASFITRVEHNSVIDSIKTEHTSYVKSMSEKFDDVKTRLDKAEGRGVGLNAGWIYLLGVVAAIGTFVSIIVAIRT